MNPQNDAALDRAAARAVFVAEAADAGMRLDNFIAARMPDLSRSYVQRLIAQGAVRVNGNAGESKHYILKAGDSVAPFIPAREALRVVAEDIPLRIVHEDEDLLVVDKPRGMVVHPAPGNESGTLVNAVLFHCGDSLSSINGVIRPGIVHRIDKDTSGLLVVAKNDRAHRALSEALARHEVTREYEAVVYNNFAEDLGKVDLPIGRDPANRLRRAVTADGRAAVTHYRVLERFGSFTRLALRLETGRTHQIRVHMAHIKHPLLGDPLYGPKKKALGVETQMLHAGLLGFRHPRTGAYTEFSCPPPAAYERILERLRAAGEAAASFKELSVGD
ncbi:MAG: RluA family pseudouridine synthase [Clostridiales Family XIII bacterium]|jgi:23S rRNA pseudouridine1911/1915/1917 synthase|nr:RluA family pseudouridine synthase [Clostridiales Family XIII bacterium]